MKIKNDNNTIVFESTGREEYCHNGEIGISPDGEYVVYGHDGGWNREEFTSQEQHELADQMIAMWTRFKASIDE